MSASVIIHTREVAAAQCHQSSAALCRQMMLMFHFFFLLRSFLFEAGPSSSRPGFMAAHRLLRHRQHSCVCVCVFSELQLLVKLRNGGWSTSN